VSSSASTEGVRQTEAALSASAEGAAALCMGNEAVARVLNLACAIKLLECSASCQDSVMQWIELLLLLLLLQER
jgi:hypothetical protein